MLLTKSLTYSAATGQTWAGAGTLHAATQHVTDTLCLLGPNTVIIILWISVLRETLKSCNITMPSLASPEWERLSLARTSAPLGARPNSSTLIFALTTRTSPLPRIFEVSPYYHSLYHTVWELTISEWKSQESIDNLNISDCSPRNFFAHICLIIFFFSKLSASIILTRMRME